MPYLNKSVSHFKICETQPMDYSIHLWTAGHLEGTQSNTYSTLEGTQSNTQKEHKAIHRRNTHTNI